MHYESTGDIKNLIIFFFYYHRNYDKLSQADMIFDD